MITGETPKRCLPGVLIHLFIPVLLDLFLVLFGGPEGGFTDRRPFVGIGTEVLMIRALVGILAEDGGYADEPFHLGPANLTSGEGGVTHPLLRLKDVPMRLALIFVSRHVALL
jgi:hypothetical protein